MANFKWLLSIETVLLWCIIVLIFQIDTNVSRKIALRWMWLDRTDDKSSLLQVKAWGHQAKSHYIYQCPPTFMSLYDVNRPRRVKGHRNHQPSVMDVIGNFTIYQNDPKWPKIIAHDKVPRMLHYIAEFEKESQRNISKPGLEY